MVCIRVRNQISLYAVDPPKTVITQSRSTDLRLSSAQSKYSIAISTYAIHDIAHSPTFVLKELYSGHPYLRDTCPHQRKRHAID